MALAAAEGVRDAVAEQAAVGQAGERVVQGLVGKPPLKLLALGDVGHHAADTEGVAVAADTG